MTIHALHLSSLRPYQACPTCIRGSAPDLAAIAESEERATEYLHFRQFFIVWETLDRVVSFQALEVDMDASRVGMLLAFFCYLSDYWEQAQLAQVATRYPRPDCFYCPSQRELAPNFHGPFTLSLSGFYPPIPFNLQPGNLLYPIANQATAAYRFETDNGLVQPPLALSRPSDFALFFLFISPYMTKLFCVIVFSA